MPIVHIASVDSPVGPLRLASTEAGLAYVALPHASGGGLSGFLRHPLPDASAREGFAPNRVAATQICEYLEVPMGRAKFSHFSAGETYVEIKENVRGVNCFVVQPTSQPVNENLMELLIAIDALRLSSAGSIIE